MCYSIDAIALELKDACIFSITLAINFIHLKVKSKFLISVTVVLTSALVSCTEYEDVFLQANKEVFVKNEIVEFVNFQNSETVTLQTQAYSCGTGSFYDTYQSTHHYHRNYTQKCGQSVHMNDKNVHSLDHSIFSEITREGYFAKIYFEADIFTILPLPDDNVAVLDSLNIQGIFYPHVYVLSAEFTANEHNITSIYYHPDFGILQVIDRNNQIWIRTK